jgi:hypothetical protein
LNEDSIPRYNPIREGNYYSLTEEKTQKQIIVQICTRLSIGKLNHHNDVYDPKGVYFGSVRLFRTIGHMVRPGTFKRMCKSSSDDWKYFEDTWSALMSTVILNPDFNP